MKRRTFLKTMGLGVASLSVCPSLLVAKDTLTKSIGTCGGRRFYMGPIEEIGFTPEWDESNMTELLQTHRRIIQNG